MRGGIFFLPNVNQQMHLQGGVVSKSSLPTLKQEAGKQEDFELNLGKKANQSQFKQASEKRKIL